MNRTYSIRPYDTDRLQHLLRQFRNSVHRTFPNDAGLADLIEAELMKNRKHQLSESTLKRLARWCKTAGTPYQDAMPVAREISSVLYGFVVDREELGT
jgi:hypothetical protein